MKMRFLVVPIAALLFGGCSSDSDDTTPNGQTNQTVDSGALSGLVTDANNGKRLSGVKVMIGSQETTTDDNGEFVLSNLADADYIINLTKDNYAPGFSNVSLSETSEAILVSLKAEGSRQDYNPATEQTLYEETVNGPYAVTFGAGTLDTTDTNLKVSVTPLDPTTEAEALPGQLETDTAMLVPLTFAEFSIYDSANNKVNLKAGEEAVVELPIPIALRNLDEYALGKTIHCYSYNPVTGQWEDFVVGTVVKSSIDGTTPVVRASIKHFSWYGAAPQSSDCIDIYGQVVSSVTGSPLPNARVEAFPGSATTSDANGRFQLATAATGTPKITASRTFVDTDGSAGGTAGARVIEYGTVADIPLVGLVTRPCSDAPGSNPNNDSSTEPGSPTNPLVITIGTIGQLSYEVTAYLIQGSVIALVKTNVADSDLEGEDVSGARLVLTGPDNLSLQLTENSFASGYYSATLDAVPGQRYTLSIDADNNGTVDGTGSVFMIGTVNFTNPTADSTVNNSNLTISWTDTAYDSPDVDPAYSAVYWAWIYSNELDNSSGTQFGFDGTNYLGTDLSFLAKSKYNDDMNLAPGTYSATIWAFSGAYQPTSADFDVSILNNITGPSVTGQFYVWEFTDSSVSFTIQETP